MSIHVKTAAGWEEIGISGTPGELPGIGGWATITSVSGSPKRYAYNDGSVDWVAFEWTADGSLTTLAGGLVDAFLIGSGGNGRNGFYNGGAGRVVSGLHIIDKTNPISIGQPGVGAGAWGDATTVGPLISGRTGVESGAGSVAGNVHKPLESGILGFDETFGHGNSPSGARPNRGDGGNAAGDQNGSSGTCIVRVPAAQAEKVDPGKWVTRSNYFAVVENGVVTETYTEHHYGNGTITPLPQTDLIPCDAQVTEGYSYDNGEFVAPAPDPTAVEELVAELQAQIDTLRKA